MDKEEFLNYYKEYVKPIVNFTYKMTDDYGIAEEISQDVFIKLYDNFDKLKSNEHRRYWIFTVAKNACLNYLKKKNKEKHIYKKYYNENNKEVLDYSELERNELSLKVKQAIDKLPKKMKMALLLKEYSGMNYKEIGKVLKTTEGNVKIMIFRAKKQLFELLKEDIKDYE